MVHGVSDRGLISWRGLPYAAPPVGVLRFAPPADVVPWEGLRNASQFGAIAPQPVASPLLRPPSQAIAPSEDCLTVNVHAPTSVARTSTSLPVMIFIHGGGYGSGSSRDFSGQGDGFVRTGRVVYVSFNYRLGPLGYLDFSRYSSPERSFAANLGLRDQIALLEWVRHNIAGFGGDPDNVTVFGESAGGNAVTTLMATPSARGLFARAIAQSAPPDAVYPRQLTSRWAEEYVELLRGVAARRERAGRSEGGGGGAGGVGGDSVDTSDGASTPQHLLANASIGDLVAASVALQVRTPDAYPGAFCFAPVIDGDILPERPMRAFREGRAHRVPLVIGTNDREGSIFRGRVDILPRTPARIAALFARAPVAAHRAMHDAYPGLPARRPAADFSGDYGFWFPCTRVADFHSRYAPVWSYRFDVAPRLLELMGLDATHGVEMFALFDRTDLPLARLMTSLGGLEMYAAAGERMRGDWLRFAEHGSPDASWPQYGERARETRVIDTADRVEADPRRDRRRAWTRFSPALAG